MGRGGVGLSVREKLIGGHGGGCIGAGCMAHRLPTQAEGAGVDPVDKGPVGDVVHQVAPVVRRVRCSPSWCSSRRRSSAFWLRS